MYSHVKVPDRSLNTLFIKINNLCAFEIVLNNINLFSILGTYKELC